MRQVRDRSSFRSVLAAWAATGLAFSPAAVRASDYFHVCRTADGRFEMNDGALYRVDPGGEQGKEIAYDTLREDTQRRETGYCIAAENGKKYEYESRTYTLRAAFQDEGRRVEETFICDFAADGLPAAYTCKKQVVAEKEGDDVAPAEPPAGAAPSLWMHNGSVMRLEASGARRTFFYQAPRSGMIKAGAKSGTMLFEGNRDGRTYSGVAYIFSKGCKPAPYSVTGKVSEDDRRITLSGEAPRLDKTCRSVGTKKDTLVFQYRPDLTR